MSDEQKKPRKLKDLKARLGRTITPTTPGAPGDVAPPPGLGGDDIAPPPASVGSASIDPPAGISPRGVVAPPSIQKKREEAERRKAVAAADPFASGAVEPQNKQHVIVIDDSAVDHSEIGKAQNYRNMMLVVGGLVIGILAGYGSGSMMGGRQQYNVTVTDGDAIYDTVRDASNVITDMEARVRRLTTAANGAPGTPPSIDYDAIIQLRTIEKPFEAHAFTNRNYNAFSPETVDSLFRYMANVEDIWTRITRLKNLVSGEGRREELDAAAASVGAMGAGEAETGCIPTVENNQFFCDLVFVRLHQEEGEAPKLMVRQSRLGRREVEKQVYTGQRFDRNPGSASNYVIRTNTNGSTGVLGQSLGIFTEYKTQLQQLKTLLTETTELQGRLEAQIGEVAALEEIWTL